MSGHTPEPWVEYTDAEWRNPEVSKYVHLCRNDYDRAALCVNALAGLNPAAIPKMAALVRDLAARKTHEWYLVRARAIVAEMEKKPGRTREDAE